MKKLLVSVMVLGVLAIVARQGEAEVIASRTRTNPTFINGGGGINVPLNNAGSTLMPFVTTQDNQRVVITYSAECGVRAACQTTNMSVIIRVDGLNASPTSLDSAMCTSHNNAVAATNNSLVGDVMRAVVVVEDAGLHTVGVFADLTSECVGAVLQGNFDDSTITVEK